MASVRELLMRAIDEEDVPAISSLLETDESLSKAFVSDGNTALHHTIIFGKFELSRIFINHGSDVTQPNLRGDTCLHHLAPCSDVPPWMVTLLLGKKANINAANGIRNQPLHCALIHRNRGVASLLISNGANVRAKGNAGNTPLHCAAGHTPVHCGTNGDVPELIELLVENGGQVNEVNNREETPLHLAVKANLVQCVRALLQSGADPSLVNKCDECALHYAVACDTPDVMVEALVRDGHADVNQTNSHGQTALHLALHLKRPNLAAYLIEQNADPNSVDCNGTTALHLSADYGLLGMTHYLLRNGAIVELDDPKREPAWCVAIRNGYVETLKLLALGTNLPAVSGAVWAHALPTRNPYVVQCLICLGVDVNVRNESGCLPLHRVASAIVNADSATDHWRSKEIIRHLLEGGTDREAFFALPSSAEGVKFVRAYLDAMDIVYRRRKRDLAKAASRSQAFQPVPQELLQLICGFVNPCWP